MGPDDDYLIITCKIPLYFAWCFDPYATPLGMQVMYRSENALTAARLGFSQDSRPYTHRGVRDNPKHHEIIFGNMFSNNSIPLRQVLISHMAEVSRILILLWDSLKKRFQATAPESGTPGPLDCLGPRIQSASLGQEHTPTLTDGSRLSKIVP